MQGGAVGEAFDACNFTAFDIETEHQARENRTPVDQHRAGAAFAQFAAMLGAGEIEIFAQDFKQSLVWRECNLGCFAVQGEFDMRLLLQAFTPFFFLPPLFSTMLS